MMQQSIETKLARADGYPAFMSPEHISLVLKREATNGKGDGRSVCSDLSSSDRAPLSQLTDGVDGVNKV